MVFSSSEFLFFFLPVALIGYLILPRGGEPVWLFAASLFFYVWGEPRFFLLFAVSFVLNWAAGLQLGRAKKGRKLWLQCDGKIHSRYDHNEKDDPQPLPKEISCDDQEE